LETIYTDLLSIGAGLAGERVAVEAAAAGFDSICLSIVPPRRSHSSAAQGGMQGECRHLWETVPREREITLMCIFRIR